MAKLTVKDRLAEECWIPDPVVEPLAIKIAQLFINERRRYVASAGGVNLKKQMPIFRKAAELCIAQSLEPERYVATQVAAMAQVAKIFPQGLLSQSLADRRGVSIESSREDEIAHYRAEILLLSRVEHVFGVAMALRDPDLQISPALRCWAAERAGLPDVVRKWWGAAEDQLTSSSIAAKLFARKDRPCTM